MRPSAFGDAGKGTVRVFESSPKTNTKRHPVQCRIVNPLALKSVVSGRIHEAA